MSVLQLYVFYLNWNIPLRHLFNFLENVQCQLELFMKMCSYKYQNGCKLHKIFMLHGVRLILNCTVCLTSYSKVPFLLIWIIFFHTGPRALYKGLGPTLVRCFPACGALFVAYEGTQKLLENV